MSSINDGQLTELLRGPLELAVVVATRMGPGGCQLWDHLGDPPPPVDVSVDSLLDVHGGRRGSGHGIREVSVVEVREVLRRWVLGEGQRSIDRNTGVDRKTVRRYVEAAKVGGGGRRRRGVPVDRCGDRGGVFGGATGPPRGPWGGVGGVWSRTSS